jgi:hypothetical protein
MKALKRDANQLILDAQHMQQPHDYGGATAVWLQSGEPVHRWHYWTLTASATRRRRKAEVDRDFERRTARRSSSRSTSVSTNATRCFLGGRSSNCMARLLVAH